MQEDNNDYDDSDEEMLDEHGKYLPKTWNDVWDAFFNPNRERFMFAESICVCVQGEPEGFYIRNNHNIHCADCHIMVAPYKICPHSKLKNFRDIKKCLLCKKIIDYNEEIKYYLKITCTHDFKHVGKKYVRDPDLNNDDENELYDAADYYCFQCNQFI
jgi:hypothetical protein